MLYYRYNCWEEARLEMETTESRSDSPLISWWRKRLEREMETKRPTVIVPNS
ncbi:MAG: hypothetical protein NVS2B2_29380 [Ktedonobacteraceae bacterium]